MPIYAFKCPNCKKEMEAFITFGEFNEKNNTTFGICINKKCKTEIRREHQILNFQGAINMNASSVGVANRKYSNKAGGPKPIIDDKVRNDLKMKS